MPWKETDAMDQRMKFIVEWNAALESKTELCRRYGIQRRIGYKWVQRYLRDGPAGLADRSRAPLHHPQQIEPERVSRILEIRAQHPLWGAPKIRAILKGEQPQQHPPAASTIGEILRQEGLTRPRKKRRRTPPYSEPLAHAKEPNDVVSIDLKGWFLCRDGTRIDPLTLVDNASRYALCCQAVDACNFVQVQRVLESVFLQYGLPRAIRSDNGAPFASRAIAGLSRLSVWWLRLGIEVERIPPATPSANGRQERFHRTLKQHTADPPAANRRAQQRAFESFCHEYNEQRPHQALGQQVPASLYRASGRPYPSELPPVEYPSSFLRRKVGQRGEIYWRGARIFVSEVLYGETLGLEAIDDGIYRVWFLSLELGEFDERRGRLAPLSRRRDNGPSGPPSPPLLNGSQPANSSEPASSSGPAHNPEPTSNLESASNSKSTLTTPTKGGNLFTMSPV
jgi:transposase InsO family protein